MNESFSSLPSRKVTQSVQYKKLLFIIFLVIIALSVFCILYLTVVSDYLKDEANVKYYFDKNGSFSASYGRFSRSKINNENDALNSLEKLENTAFDDTDYKVSLKLINKTELNSTTVYRFAQNYNGIEVTGGFVSVSADGESKALSCVSSYVNNISKYISKEDIESLKKNYIVTNEELYLLTADDKPVEISVINDSSKPVIYTDKNDAPALGKYAQIKAVSDGVESCYHLILDVKTGIPVKLYPLIDLKNTDNKLVDNAQACIALGLESQSVKLSINDLYKVCKNSDWKVKSDIDGSDKDIPSSMIKYESFKLQSKLSESLNENFYAGGDFASLQDADNNALILDYVMYNIFMYGCNEDYRNFEKLFGTTVSLLCGDVSYEDFYLAALMSCDVLNLSDYTKDAVKQCFDACGIEFGFTEIYKKDLKNAPKKELSENAVIEVKQKTRSQSDIDSILELHLSYYKKHFDTKKSSVFLEDLSHDGLPEMIVVNYKHWKDEHKIDMKVYTVSDGKIKKLVDEEALETRTGHNSLFVYKANGRAYLYSYNPINFLGAGTYSHEIYSFDSDGNKKIYDKGDISFGDNMQNKADSKKVKAYIADNLKYLDNSYLCANTYPKNVFYSSKAEFEDDNSAENDVSRDGYAKNSYKKEFEKWSDSIKID